MRKWVFKLPAWLKDLLHCEQLNLLPCGFSPVWMREWVFKWWFVALRTIVPPDSTVGLLVIPKATSTCKCLGTLVTRLSICHLYFSPPLSVSVSFWLGNNSNIIHSILSLSLSTTKKVNWVWISSIFSCPLSIFNWGLIISILDMDNIHWIYPYLEFLAASSSPTLGMD